MPFLAVMGFNSNLVHFVPPYHVIISNVQVCFFTGTICHVHGRATKTVSRKIRIYEGLHTVEIVLVV